MVDILAGSFCEDMINCTHDNTNKRFRLIQAAIDIVYKDFIQEGKNAERTAKNFISNDKVKVPKVVWVRFFRFSIFSYY